MKNKLAEIRKDNEITQSELATIMSVSRNTISSLETGKYNPSLKLAHKIAEYFDLDIEEIFIFDDEKSEQEISDEIKGEMAHERIQEVPNLLRKTVTKIINDIMEALQEDETEIEEPK